MRARLLTCSVVSIPVSWTAYLTVEEHPDCLCVEPKVLKGQNLCRIFLISQVVAIKQVFHKQLGCPCNRIKKLRDNKSHYSHPKVNHSHS